MLNRTLLSNLGNKVNISLPDTSNILFAFSTRRLVPTATKQGKWIKTSGGTNPDIYFKSNGMYDVNKDESNITYTNYLYNQVSQYRNASQATFAKCPTIASGSVVYKGFKSDGIDDYLSIPVAVGLPDSVFNASYSINVWVNMPNVSGVKAFFDHVDATTGYHSIGKTAGKINYYCYGTVPLTTTSDIDFDTWTMITTTKAGTGNNATMKIYVNGIQCCTKSSGDTYSATARQTTICGSITTSFNSITTLNDIILYSKALSQEQITQIYNQTRNYYV